MQSASARANAVLTYGFVALVAVALLSHATHYALSRPGAVHASVTLHAVHTLCARPACAPPHSRRRRAVPRMRYVPAGDVADWTFDLAADLRPLWSWNTKQLFVWLQANYTTSAHERNVVVVWDRIVPTHDEAAIDVRGARTEYFLSDHGHHLRGARVSLALCWDVMPLAGLLRTGCVPLDTFVLPDSYTST